MSTKQRVLLAVVAIVIVAAYVVGVAGGSPGQGNPGQRSGLADWLAGLGGGSQEVPATLVHAECAHHDGSVQFAGSCVIHVSDPGTMKLLVLTSAMPFTVLAPSAGDASFTVRSDVSVDEDSGTAQAKVAVDKDADIDVVCPGLSTCLITLGERASGG